MKKGGVNPLTAKRTGNMISKTNDRNAQNQIKQWNSDKPRAGKEMAQRRSVKVSVFYILLFTITKYL